MEYMAKPIQAKNMAQKGSNNTSRNAPYLWNLDQIQHSFFIALTLSTSGMSEKNQIQQNPFITLSIIQ